MNCVHSRRRHSWWQCIAGFFQYMLDLVINCVDSGGTGTNLVRVFRGTASFQKPHPDIFLGPSSPWLKSNVTLYAPVDRHSVCTPRHSTEYSQAWQGKA